METPAGVIQPTGAKVNIPCADFFYMRNGKIERFDCYPVLNIMLKQMACRLTSLPRSSVRPNGDTSMSYSISTVLIRTLHDVFGQNDPEGD